jgi:hypothetical protein
MSHIVEAKTRIVYPNLSQFLSVAKTGGKEAVAQLPFIALLREAVNLVAHEQRGEVLTYYLDYSGNQHEVNTSIALHIPQQADRPRQESLKRGIGLSIDETTGALTFIGDPYRVKDFYEAMQRQIVQKYAALAYMAALRGAQYQHVSVRAVEHQLVVSGEIYA